MTLAARRALPALALLAALSSLAVLAQQDEKGPDAPAKKKPYAVGDAVKDSSLNGLDGKAVRLLPLMKDKTVVLSFFSKG